MRLSQIVRKVLLEYYEGGNLTDEDSVCDVFCARKKISQNSTGEIVKLIQHYLTINNFGDKNLGGIRNCSSDWKNCDGIFGKKTKLAVLNFQIKSELNTKDGIIGYFSLTEICSNKGNFLLPDSIKKILCKKCDCDSPTTDPIDNEYIPDYKLPFPELKNIDIEKVIKGEYNFQVLKNLVNNWKPTYNFDFPNKNESDNKLFDSNENVIKIQDKIYNWRNEQENEMNKDSSLSDNEKTEGTNNLLEFSEMLADKLEKDYKKRWEGIIEHYDFWQKIISPRLLFYGFKYKNSEQDNQEKKCVYACCKSYVFKGKTSDLKVYLECGDKPTERKWKLIVKNQKTGKFKSFQPTETGANDAVIYAIDLLKKT